MIDSEQVPWGKGEKHPGKGDEIVSETIYLQGVGAVHSTEIPITKLKKCFEIWNLRFVCILEFGIWNFRAVRGDGVPIEEWANEFIVCGLTNPPCAEQSKWKRGLIARFYFFC